MDIESEIWEPLGTTILGVCSLTLTITGSNPKSFLDQSLLSFTVILIEYDPKDFSPSFHVFFSRYEEGPYMGRLQPDARFRSSTTGEVFRQQRNVSMPKT